MKLQKVVSVAMVIALLALTLGSVGVSAQADPTISAWTTGVDIQNLSDSPSAYSIDFYKADGTLAYTYTPAAPLGARGGANVYIPNLPESSLPAGSYSAVVNSEQMVAAVVGLQSYSASNPQFGGADIYLGTAAPANTLVFPLVYRNHTVRRWYSTLVVQNATDADQSVTVTLINSGATTPAATKTVTIKGFASYSFDTEAAEFSAFGPFGSAIVTGSAPLAGVAFNVLKGRMTNPDTNYLDTINSEYRAFTAEQFGRNVVAPSVYKNYNQWTTGINVVNTTATPTEVTVTYTNANPAVAGGPWTETKTLNGLSMEVFYTPSTPGLPDGFFGSATVASTASDIAVVVSSQRYRATGAEGVAYEGALASSATKCASLPVSHNRTTWKTGINVLNMSGTDATLTLNYFSSAAGISNAGPQNVTVPANKPLTIYMPGLPSMPAVTQVGFYGAVDVKSTQPILVNVSNSRNDTTSHGVASTYMGINYACP